MGQIQRERLVPQLKQGNYSQGIYDTVQAYVATLAEKRGFTIEGIDQRYAYRNRAHNRGSAHNRVAFPEAFARSDNSRGRHFHSFVDEARAGAAVAAVV